MHKKDIANTVYFTLFLILWGIGCINSILNIEILL